MKEKRIFILCILIFSIFLFIMGIVNNKDIVAILASIFVCIFFIIILRDTTFKRNLHESFNMKEYVDQNFQYCYNDFGCIVTSDNRINENEFLMFDYIFRKYNYKFETKIIDGFSTEYFFKRVRK